MDLQSYVKNGHLAIIAKPNASRTEIVGYDESRAAVKIAIAAPPDENKANVALLKFLRKELGRDVVLVSGKTGRKKLVRIIS